MANRPDDEQGEEETQGQQWPGEWQSASDVTTERGEGNTLEEAAQGGFDTSIADAGGDGILITDTSKKNSFLLRRVSLILALLLVLAIIFSVAGVGSLPYSLRQGTSFVTQRIGFILMVLLVLTIIVLLVGVSYTSVQSRRENASYIDFYILNPDGDRPDIHELTVNEDAQVTVGVVNRKQTQVTYTVVVTANDRTLRTETLTLVGGETKEHPLTYSLKQPGPTEVSFLLYRGRDPDLDSPPYQSVRVGTIVSPTD